MSEHSPSAQMPAVPLCAGSRALAARAADAMQRLAAETPLAARKASPPFHGASMRARDPEQVSRERSFGGAVVLCPFPRSSACWAGQLEQVAVDRRVSAQSPGSGSGAQPLANGLSAASMTSFSRCGSSSARASTCRPCITATSRRAWAPQLTLSLTSPVELEGPLDRALELAECVANDATGRVIAGEDFGGGVAEHAAARMLPHFLVARARSRQPGSRGPSCDGACAARPTTGDR
jgi:hypothetical protein